MKRIGILLLALILCLCCSVTTIAAALHTKTIQGSGTLTILAGIPNVIVDHTNFNYCSTSNTSITGLSVYFAHASVGQNVTDGMVYLHDVGSVDFPLPVITSNSTAPQTLTSAFYHDYRGNPGWQAKITGFATALGSGGWSKANIVMNKFCYIDYAADWIQYRDSMVSLEQLYPNVKFVYMTIPLKADEGSSNIAINGFNTNLRQWIATQQGKRLYDIADLEAWHRIGGISGTDEQCLFGDQQQYQKMWSGYTSDYGHPDSSDAEERLALAMCSLLELIKAGN